MLVNFKKIILLVLSFDFLLSQSQNEVNLWRLAQSFERAGEYERALKIYEELYLKNPDNRTYLDALVRLNAQTKNYDRAIYLARLWLSNHPDDIDMMSKLGDVHFKAGKEKEAIEIWDKIIRTYKDNPGVYRMVADYLIQNRLFDKAIEYLTTAQKIAGAPELYSYEIAMLYEFTMRFDKAVLEYIKLLKRTPSMLPSVKSRMSAYIDRADVLKQIIPILDSEARASKTNIGILELYAWVLNEARDFDKALDVYKQLDKITFANGEVILNFANDLFNRRIFNMALKAYDEVIKNFPNSKLLPEAKFGYIRSREEILRQRLKNKIENDTLLFSEFKKVESDYTEISKEFQATKYEAEALFRIGLIELDVFFDLDRAQRYFEEVEKKFMLYLGREAIFKIAEILTLKGDLNAAEEKYRHLLNLKNFPDTLKAKFSLAQVWYYQGEFERARKVLEDVSKITSSDYSNDAIELLLKIQTNRFPSDKPLREFALAELKLKQRKYGEAISILEDIISNCSNCPIVDDAIFTLAMSYKAIEKFDKSIEYLDIIINEHPESIYADDAMMEKGIIYQENLNKREMAIDTFMKLISKFPNSIYVSEARKRVRELRGEIQ